jgi:natural product precursor
MKKLQKLRLNVLNEQDLKEKQMNALRGGEDRFCTCSCSAPGGSGIVANRDANYVIGPDGGYSGQGDNNYWYDGYDGAYGDNAVIIYG